MSTAQPGQVKSYANLMSQSLSFPFLFSTCYGPTIEVALCSEFELVAKVRTRNNS
jgi:hypothetical protein